MIELNKVTEKKGIWDSMRIYTVYTSDAFIPESAYEEVGRLSGLGEAGNVRMTMPTASGWDADVGAWKHTFVY